MATGLPFTVNDQVFLNVHAMISSNITLILVTSTHSYIAVIQFYGAGYIESLIFFKDVVWPVSYYGSIGGIFGIPCT